MGPVFEILYSDDHVAVVHKPAGLPTVPSHGEPGLVDLVERELDRVRYGRRDLAVVHRLDRQTSGVLVFARTTSAATALARQFAAHRTEREYVALVAGRVALDQGTIREPLHGKGAVTHYRVLARHADVSLLVVRLETGRRNQIRMHCADLGHPVLGDTRFRPDLACRPDWPDAGLGLHARSLGFEHPRSRKTLRFEAPLPLRFVTFCSEGMLDALPKPHSPWSIS